MVASLEPAQRAHLTIPRSGSASKLVTYRRTSQTVMDRFADLPPSFLSRLVELFAMQCPPALRKVMIEKWDNEALRLPERIQPIFQRWNDRNVPLVACRPTRSFSDCLADVNAFAIPFKILPSKHVLRRVQAHELRSSHHAKTRQRNERQKLLIVEYTVD
jgi:hypothetical protein